MIKTIYRLLIHFFSNIINTDKISEFYPVSVKAIIIDRGKIILLKNERGEWDFPGGKITSYDQPKETLIREVREELGIKIKELTIYSSINLVINNVKVIILLYKAKVASKDPIEISFEHLDYGFFTKEETMKINILKEYLDILNKIDFHS